MGYEAELHSPAGRARRRRGVSRRRPAPQLSQSGRRAWRHASAISQAVRALEARVGAALFARTTRSVGLTEAGERFLTRAKPAFEELVAASAAARDLGRAADRAVAPHGAASGGAATARAADRIVLRGPSGNRGGDRGGARSSSISRPAGFDAGIRLGQFIAADMVTVRLTPPFPFVVVGSPIICGDASGPNGSTICASTPACACDARTGRSRPGHSSTATRRSRWWSQDLSSPIIFRPFSARRSRAWALRNCPRRSSRRRVTAGKLMRVLEPFAPTAPGVFLYYPSRHQMMPKLRAFIDHVKSRQHAARKIKMEIKNRGMRPRARAPAPR